MKLIIIRDNFKKGLIIIEKIAGKNFSLPILDNVLIKTFQNFLTLSGTNLELGISYWTLAKIEKEGQITIPAKLLFNLINFLPDEKIYLESKNNTLFVSGEKFKAQIKGLPAEDFPIIPQIKDEKKFIEVNNLPFLQGLSKILNFCSTSQTHLELSGVYFNFQKEKLELVSTDSFRLAKKDLYYQEKNSKVYSFILPQRTVRELTNILSEKDSKSIENYKTKIYFEPNQVFFEIISENFSFPQFRLASRLIEGEYPNYQEIIPKSYQTRAVLNKNDFLNQIKTAALFSGKINRIKIKLETKQNLLSLFSQSPETGEIKSSLSGEIKGENIEISFNSKFLIDGLLNLEGQKIIFELNGEDGPAVLRSDEDPSYIYIVMPVKS